MCLGSNTQLTSSSATTRFHVRSGLEMWQREGLDSLSIMMTFSVKCLSWELKSPQTLPVISAKRQLFPECDSDLGF